jgi:dihydroorotase
MAEAGMIGTKLFLGNTTGDNPCPSDGAVLEGFEILAELGLRCSIHAENSPILFWRQNKMKAAGRTDPLSHLAARTDVVAVEALNRAATLADWTGARIHIVHESCAARSRSSLLESAAATSPWRRCRSISTSMPRALRSRAGT